MLKVPTLTLTPALTLTLTLVPLLKLAVTSNLTALPVIFNLRKVFTVKDVWRKWKEGFGGQPVIQKLKA